MLRMEENQPNPNLTTTTSSSGVRQHGTSGSFKGVCHSTTVHTDRLLYADSPHLLGPHQSNHQQVVQPHSDQALQTKPQNKGTRPHCYHRASDHLVLSPPLLLFSLRGPLRMVILRGPYPPPYVLLTWCLRASYVALCPSRAQGLSDPSPS